MRCPMFDRAYAKINLALNVVRRKEDGYHDIESIMVPVSFFDTVEILPNHCDEFICNKKYIVFNESNTIYKMLELVRKEFNIKDNFKISLDKKIPTRAGLGGGTSDGAAVLRILNKMYNLNLDNQQIRKLCLAVGADTYFNYYNKPSLVRGIGDQLEFFNLKKDYYILICKPSMGVSTKKAYETLDLNTCDHPNIALIQKGLQEGEDVRFLLGNSLQQPSIKLVPQIASIKNQLLENGAEFALMSGSGSAVFTYSEDKYKIQRLYETFKDKHYFCRYCQIIKQ